MSGIKLSYRVDGDNFSSAGEASEQVKMRLKQLGVDSSIIRRVAIAMYEAEINTVIHANGGKASVSIDHDCITVVVSDTGKGIENIELAMKEGYSTATSQIQEMGFGAGMGLPNMKKYSDEMDVQSVVGKGTTITMKFYLGD